jgi:hypothetical protein
MNTQLFDAIRAGASLIRNQADKGMEIANKEGARDGLKEDCLELYRVADMLYDHAVSLSKPVTLPWQPIETAPKDGTRILTCEEGVVLENQWFNFDVLRRHKGTEYCRWFSQQNPTHWMPLPKPPTTKRDKDNEY